MSIPDQSRVAEVERQVDEAQAGGKPLGVSILRDFAKMFKSLAAYHQPGHPDKPNKHFNEEKFERYARLAVACAKELAAYESPTFRVIPSLQSPAAAAENAPEPQPEPGAPSQRAEAPIEAPVSEPAASVAPPAPVAQPAAPWKYLRLCS